MGEILITLFIIACIGVVVSFCVVCVGDLEDKFEKSMVWVFIVSMAVVLILSTYWVISMTTTYKNNKNTTLSVNSYAITSISREQVSFRDKTERLILYANDKRFVVDVEDANVRVGEDNIAKVRIDGNEDEELVEIIITVEIADRLGYL